MTEHDALRTLGLPEGTSEADIRQAYLDLVRVWHPDRFESDDRLRDKAERTLQEINAAYAVLEGGVPPSVPRMDQPPAAPVGPPPAPAPTPPPAADEPNAMLMRAGWAGLGAVVGVVLVMLLTAGGAAPPAETVVPAPTPRDASTASSAATAGPDARLADPLRPESGTDLLTAFPSGLGVLTVHNATPRDAVLVLSRGSSQERALFVRSQEEVTALDIAAGTYRILVMQGFQWRRDHFTSEPDHREFERTADFVERETRDGTDSTKVSLSLQEVGGVATLTRAVPAFTLQVGQ